MKRGFLQLHGYLFQTNINFCPLHNKEDMVAVLQSIFLPLCGFWETQIHFKNKYLPNSREDYTPKNLKHPQRLSCFNRGSIMILLLDFVVQSFLSRMNTESVIQQVHIKRKMFKELFHKTSHVWILKDCLPGLVILNSKQF